jgi:hypothetical protein
MSARLLNNMLCHPTYNLCKLSELFLLKASSKIAAMHDAELHECCQHKSIIFVSRLSFTLTAYLINLCQAADLCTYIPS